MNPRLFSASLAVGFSIFATGASLTFSQESSVSELRRSPSLGGLTDAYVPTTLDILVSAAAADDVEIEGASSLLHDDENPGARLVENLAEDLRFRVDEVVTSVTGGFRPETIIDGDWKVVRDTTKKPFSGVCLLRLKYKSKRGEEELYWATGAFVSERVIATAAHNLYSVADGRAAESVEVIPGNDGAIRPFGSQAAMRMYVLTSYLTSGADADDFGWVVLPDRKLFSRAGYAFGYRIPSYAQIRDWNLNSCGYPEPESRGMKMYRDYETRSQRPALFNRSFRYWHDTEHGCSGGPLFVHLDGVSYLAGVCVGQTRDWNIGCRIDRDVFEITRNLTTKYP